MQQRYISNINLGTLTSAQAVSLWMSFETYQSLCADRERLSQQLLDATSKSVEANALIAELSLLAGVCDDYEVFHSVKEAA